MAVDDQVVLTGITLILIYMLIYRKNRLLGGILFISTSLALYSYTTLNAVWPFLILAISFITFISDAFEKLILK